MNTTLSRWVDSYIDTDEAGFDPAKLVRPEAVPHHERLERDSENLAAAVADQLRRKHDWAKQAILQAQMGPAGAAWVFGERLEHFADEKEFMAERFGAWLVERCLNRIHRTSRGRQVSDRGGVSAMPPGDEPRPEVILILDSGTTMEALFRRLVALFVNPPKIQNIMVVTNNIPAVECYLRACRPEANPQDTLPSEHLPLRDRVTCMMLAGKALPDYAACTGPRAIKMLEDIRRQYPEALCIGLTTGNWVRLATRTPGPGSADMREVPTYYPVPMARGEGHREFKEALIRNSEEIYLLAPSGKCFGNVSAAAANHAWGFTNDDPDPKRHCYRDAAIAVSEDPSQDFSRRIRLVSTKRAPGQVLDRHATLLSVVLGAPSEASLDQKAVKDLTDVPHLFYLFNKFSSLPRERELLIEVPHKYARDPAFMREFLHIESEV